MVFRPEAESDRVTTHRKPHGASDGRACNTPLEKLRTRPGVGDVEMAQMRRWMLGKSSQTFTPQKCEPSVQMGVVIPARRWQGGPMYRESSGCTSRSCAISSIEAL